MERRRKDTLVQPEFVLVIVSGEIHCKIMMQYSEISYSDFLVRQEPGQSVPLRVVAFAIKLWYCAFPLVRNAIAEYIKFDRSMQLSSPDEQIPTRCKHEQDL